MKIGKDTVGEIIWRSPSNIALVKYWGKRDNQIPENPSLSFTLKDAVAISKMNYRFSPEGLSVHFVFDGKENKAFAARVEKYIQSLIPVKPLLNKLELHIDSKNTFPHSAGIASSAAGMSSLALCLNTIDCNLSKKSINNKEFFQEASNMARLASGSAARSVYGGFTTWGETDNLDDSSDNYASTLPFQVATQFSGIQDAILIINSGEKAISSSKGHATMKEHPFAKARYRQAGEHLKLMMKALEKGDWDQFITLTELEALTLHALIMSSDPGHSLLKPDTLAVIEKIRDFRKQQHLPVCFTLDAGPNVHLIYPGHIHEKIKPFIKEELLMHCQERQWIDDGIGTGPELLKNELE